MAKVMTNFQELLALKEAKQKSRYTQKEIADGVGVSESMVSRMMNGKGIEKMSLENIAKFAKWLECEIGDLVKLYPEPTP